MGRIAKNYIYTAAYNILVLLAPLVTAPYLARVLGPDNLGIYSYVNSSGNIVTTLALLGIYNYGCRQIAYVRESKTDLNMTFWELMLTRLVLGVAGTAIYMVYACFNTQYTVFFLIYYPYILAQFLDCSWLFVGLENMKPTALKNFAAKIFNIIGIFIFVKKAEDVWIYILMLAVTTFIANMSIYTQLKQYVCRPSVERKNLLVHIKGSLVLFLPQVASVFYLQVDKVMIQWLTGTTDQLSFYDQAEKIVTIPLSLITVISSVMMPRIANEFKKNHTEKMADLLFKAGKYALCMAMPMMLGIFTIARQFVPWYLGEKFTSTAVAIMILSPIVLFNSLTGISGGQYFTATDQIKVLMKAYTSAAVLNVAVNAVLIPFFGFIGAAVATVLSSLVSVVVQYYYMLKQISFKGLLGRALKYLLGAVVMAGVVFLSTWFMDATPLTTLIQIAIGLAVYFIYLLIIRDDMLKEIKIMVLRRNKR